MGHMVKNIWSYGFYLFGLPVLVEWACRFIMVKYPGKTGMSHHICASDKSLQVLFI